METKTITIQLDDPTSAEVRRLIAELDEYPTMRGLHIGDQLLERLESIAGAKGLQFARLETGIHQAAALSLYEKAGYVRCGTFGDYGADPLSVFMEKALNQ